MSSKNNTGWIGGLIVICIALLFLAGWIMNIIAIFFGPALASYGGLEILRIVGIFLAPLGGILGWI